MPPLTSSKWGSNTKICRLSYNFDNKGKVCCRVSLYKNCQQQSCSAVNCLPSGINTLARGSSVPLISARKGTDPPLEARVFHTLRLIVRQPPTSVTSLRSAHWLASDFHSWINSWIDSNQCLHNLTVNPTVQPTVESTVGPTVRPTVRCILKLCKCAITLVGKLLVITGKIAWNWRHTVLSADAGLLVQNGGWHP